MDRAQRHHAMVDFQQHQQRLWVVLEEDHEKVEKRAKQLEELLRIAYEHGRYRRLSDDELGRIGAALSNHSEEARDMVRAALSPENQRITPVEPLLAPEHPMAATPSEDGREEMRFVYRHPNGEHHTVTISREEVLNEMPDFLFEKLCGKFCNCEPVGETNVVECSCDEYAEEFQLLAQQGQEVENG